MTDVLESTDIFYKSLRQGHTAPRAPFVWTEGKWEDSPSLTEVSTLQNLWRWLGDEVWEVEAVDVEPHYWAAQRAGKVRLVRQLNWDQSVARNLAADIAEHLLLLLWEDWFEYAVDCVKAARMHATYGDEYSLAAMREAHRAAIAFDHGYGRCGPRLSGDPVPPADSWDLSPCRRRAWVAAVCATHSNPFRAATTAHHFVAQLGHQELNAWMDARLLHYLNEPRP